MKSGAALSLFPSRPKGSRRWRAQDPDAKRVEIVGFRPRVPDQLEWFEKQKEAGYNNSQILERITDLAMEIEKELSSDDYKVVEHLAREEDVAPGTIIGRAVKELVPELRARLTKKINKK